LTDWYETEQKPIVGTSLLVEVEFSSDSSDDEQDAHPHKLKLKDNAFE